MSLRVLLFVVSVLVAGFRGGCSGLCAAGLLGLRCLKVVSGV